MLAARSTRLHETTEQLVYDDLFLFLRDTESRIIQNFSPATSHPLAVKFFATLPWQHPYMLHQ
jgi:hypothetical protein